MEFFGVGSPSDDHPAGERYFGANTSPKRKRVNLRHTLNVGFTHLRFGLISATFSAMVALLSRQEQSGPLEPQRCWQPVPDALSNGRDFFFVFEGRFPALGFRPQFVCRIPR